MNNCLTRHTFRERTEELLTSGSSNVRLAFPRCGPPPGSSPWLDSWFNLRGRMECTCCCFPVSEGQRPWPLPWQPGGEAARLLASLTTQQETTCLGDRWPLFWGSTVESFQEKLGRPLPSADPEGLTGMEEIRLQQEIEWAKYRA